MVSAIAVANRTEESPVAEEPLYEVEDGKIVELPPMGAYETLIATELVWYVSGFCRKKRLGRAVNEMLFDLPVVKRQRRPDVAFVSYKRWPRTRRVPSTEAWEVVPDLAVEVVSRSNTAGEMLKKVREYFRAGVRLVWVIFPDAAEIHVYVSPKSIEVLHSRDELRGEPVLPGFRLRLSALLEL
jgi:Uma2 family endonuclease